MFCPKCGKLGFVNSSNNLTCTNYKCKYTGSAQNIVHIDDQEVDLSQIKAHVVIEEASRGHREYRDSMSPFWDEPVCRLGSTQKRRCPQCSSQNLRIISCEEECRECGAHVP
jgi:hypothetical protein